jgi:hypothetical protein
MCHAEFNSASPVIAGLTRNPLIVQGIPNQVYNDVPLLE